MKKPHLFTGKAGANKAKVRLIPEGDGFVIDRIALTLQAIVPGMDETTFMEIAEAAKTGCPLSKALASVAEISLSATLRN